MIWTDESVREALAPGGCPRSVVSPLTEFSEISTDTRTLRPEALFVAIKGERFDGHDHLAAARAAGATGAVARRGTPVVEGLILYEVDDTLAGYGMLARARRRSMTGPVVAIGGANGKTSTKEMCAAALRTRYRVHATPGNDNNLVGVPKTILAAPADTDALVIEAGASVPGELARMRAVIEPTITITTNVVASHLDGFGDLSGVLAEELDLLDGVPLAIVGTDPAALAEGARQRAQRVISAGLGRADRVPQSAAVDSTGRPTLAVDGQRITLPLLGQHQAANAMLAWSLGQELGLDPARVAEALRSLRIPGGGGR